MGAAIEVTDLAIGLLTPRTRASLIDVGPYRQLPSSGKCLNMGKPSASARLSVLERRLGARLLDRSPAAQARAERPSQ